MIFSGNHMDQSEKWGIQIIVLILTPSPTEWNSELERTTPFTDITPRNTFFPNCLKFLNNSQIHETKVLVLHGPWIWNLIQFL